MIARPVRSAGLERRSARQWTLRLAWATEVLVGSLPFPVEGQAVPPAGAFDGVRYVLDASGSMRARFGHATKLDAARAMLLELDRQLERGGDMPQPAAWVYGARAPRREHDCRDAGPLTDARGAALARAVSELQPAGVSPLVHALDSVALADSGAADAWVLFTDGSDNCGADPCAWVARSAGPGARPRIYVVGLGLAEEDERALRCLTDATSGYLLNLQPDDPWSDEMARLAAVLQNRGTLRVDARLAGEPVVIQGRLFRAGSAEALRTLRTGRIEDVPAGAYRVVVETLPPAVFDRVLVLPGQERVLSIEDLAQVRFRAFDAVNRSRTAYASLTPEDGSGEETYVSADQPAYVRAGRYRLTLELGDSVAQRRTLEIAPGEMRVVSAGGTGFVTARAQGLPQLTGVEIELHDDATGLSRSIDPWARAVEVPAGDYRALVRSLPAYVKEHVAVAAAETTAIVVPGLGTLEVDVADSTGRWLSVPVTLMRPEESGAAEGGEGAPALLGTFLSGERRAVLAGLYDLLIESEPSRLERGVRVEAGAARVVTLTVPAPTGSRP
jgi:hypothetical protein